MDSKELQELLDGATPGPWEITDRRGDGDGIEIDGGRDFCAPVCPLLTESNAALIAMAPDLATEVLRLRAELAAVLAANAGLVTRDAQKTLMVMECPECSCDACTRARAYLTGKDE